MTHQREKPGITPAQLNVTVGLPADSPTLVSGGQIEKFREGWALEIMTGPGRVAHWFKRRDFDLAVSLCQRTAPVRWLYGRGNFPCCKRCVRLRNKQTGAARAG